MRQTPPPLILASSSRYRRELLERLQLPFRVVGPEVDETASAWEAPTALAPRLALAKAQAVARDHPGAVVIGSDQVADLDGRALGKPATAERACAQLLAASGRAVHFHTAVAIVGPVGSHVAHLDRTTVRFRTLAAPEIARYVERDAPLDCAGSFRAEGLGLVLFDSIESSDPTALIGLPLMWVAGALRALGLDSLAPAE